MNLSLEDIDFVKGILIERKIILEISAKGEHADIPYIDYLIKHLELWHIEEVTKKQKEKANLKGI